MGFGKKLKSVVKKAANVTVAAGAGFVAGGGVGAVGAAGRQIVRESKGKATALNLRSVGQSAVTGLATAAASAVAVKAGGFVTAKGGLTGLAKSGFARLGGIAKGGLSGKLLKGGADLAKGFIGGKRRGAASEADAEAAPDSMTDVSGGLDNVTEKAKGLFDRFKRSENPLVVSARNTLGSRVDQLRDSTAASIEAFSNPAPRVEVVESGVAGGFGNMGVWVMVASLIFVLPSLFKKK